MEAAVRELHGGLPGLVELLGEVGVVVEARGDVVHVPLRLVDGLAHVERLGRRELALAVADALGDLAEDPRPVSASGLAPRLEGEGEGRKSGEAAASARALVKLVPGSQWPRATTLCGFALPPTQQSRNLVASASRRWACWPA